MVHAVARSSCVLVALAGLLLSVLPDVSCSGEIMKKLTGEVKVTDRTDESRQPVAAPATIYVQDFELGYETAGPDDGEQRRPILGRVLPRLSQRNDPARKAKQLVELLSESLVQGFAARGKDARRCIPGTPLPGDGWLIRGVFTELDQGKRVVRATIGFGAGASDMELYVSVSDLSVSPAAPFIVFGTEKEPGRMPGAVVTMNPYVAAAKFVLGRNASEKDVEKTASRIVEQIVGYMEKLGAGGGPVPASSSAQP